MSRNRPVSARAVPADVAAECWQYHGRITGAPHTDPAVVHLLSLLYDAVYNAELVAIPDRGGGDWGRLGIVTPTAPQYYFFLDLQHAMLPPAALEVVVQMPVVALAVGAYCRSLQAYEGGTADTWPRVRAVPINGAQTAINELRAQALGRLIFVTGTVMRLSTPHVACVTLPFRCGLCGHVVAKDLHGGPLDVPRVCQGRCRGGAFAPQRDDAAYEEVQVTRLQGGHGGADAGSAASDGAAHSVVVELRGPFIDLAAPGDVVTVGGTLATRRGEKSFAGAHLICIDAASVALHGALRKGSGGVPWLLSDRSSGDDGAQAAGRYYECAGSAGWFERLTAAVCPGIFGHANLKAALLLALVGGSDHGDLSRPAIHLLMVGDPGLGKSQVLRAVCQLSARSAYVTASTSSACGLTVSVARDPVSGETTFEAGAVVHGDGGITCIDEIDKGVAEHAALLEVMEQQTVSVAKAGMIFSMSIRTGIIAAGNPIGGRFDLYKSLAENINMTPALLSRFDVVYAMRDTASPSLTSHVLAVHRSAKVSTTGAQGGGLPNEFVAAYLAFAKREHQPVLTPGAMEVLRDAYLGQRSAERARPSDTPVTPRRLFAYIRMAQAYAKIHLRPSVTAEDAHYVVALAARCAAMSSADGAGSQPPLHSLHHATRKKLSQKDKIIEALRAIVDASGRRTVTHSEVIDACVEAGCKNPSLTMQQLSDGGLILQSSGSSFRIP